MMKTYSLNSDATHMQSRTLNYSSQYFELQDAVYTVNYHMQSIYKKPTSEEEKKRKKKQGTLGGRKT